MFLLSDDIEGGSFLQTTGAPAATGETVCCFLDREGEKERERERETGRERGDVCYFFVKGSQSVPALD